MKTLALRTFLPFLAWFPLINRASLRADLIAGLTGAVIVLPQGVAFATIGCSDPRDTSSRGRPPRFRLSCSPR